MNRKTFLSLSNREEEFKKFKDKFNAEINDDEIVTVCFTREEFNNLLITWSYLDNLINADYINGALSWSIVTENENEIRLRNTNSVLKKAYERYRILLELIRNHA